MGKGAMIGLVVLIVVILFAVVFGCMIAGTYNKQVALRTTIVQKQVDNKNEFDNMWKTISQTAQVTESQKDALKDILVGYADARTDKKGDGSLMKWITESVPNVDLAVYKNLQNIIVSARDRFTMRQKEILDLKREHDKMLQSFPSNVILAMFGCKPIDVTIVTSTKTEEAFKTGKDDDVELFKK